MTTILLILAAVVVLGLFVVVIGQCCESGSMWMFHLVMGTPTTLARILGVLVVAIIENLNGNE